jgi:hypothetical protein
MLRKHILRKLGPLWKSQISNSIEKSDDVSHVSGEFITSQSQSTLLDDLSTSDNKSQAYVTYRSCTSKLLII